MNCRELDADVVDLARGAEMSVAAAARLHAHLGMCAACAARLARERQLTVALKAMAGAAPSSAAAPAIEARLLQAFAKQQTPTSPQAGTLRPALAAPAVRVWLAAAAVLVIGVALWQGAARWRLANQSGPASTQVAASPAALEPATAASDSRPDSPASASSAGPIMPAAPDSAIVPRRSTPQAVPNDDDGVMRFVTLPTAVGLPALESGRIVRVEMPTAMLPAYGIDVAQVSGTGLVQADVLVGQDGQPRAIRFVTQDSDSRRRQ